MIPCSYLANEDVTVILIPYDNHKVRKIFTKINRYAKPTTTGQNLVIDDDDIIAVLSRSVANNVNIIGADLVKYTSNTLNDKENFFTILATLAECNDAILSANFGEKISREQLPDEARRERYKQKVNDVWECLVSSIDLFSLMLEDKEKSGDNKRREIRKDYLLGKPVPQVCLVKVFARLMHLPKGKLTFDEVAYKLNKIDWRKNAPLWDRLLMSGDKILTRTQKLPLIFYALLRVSYWMRGSE